MGLNETSGPHSRRDVLRTAFAGVTALSASAFLEACGARSPATRRSSAAAGVGRDTGKSIDLLRVALPGSLSSLYPGQESGILNYFVANICMEGLAGVDPVGRIVPGLASSVRRTSATTYVYTIRPDARFHDGSPV